MRIVQTLLIIHRHPRILLGYKKFGLGTGKWNGFGGHVEIGETIEQAAKREVEEEAGILVDDIQKLGIIDFGWDYNDEILEVHIFKAENFEGEPVETNEMRPVWFKVDEIPFQKMWVDDKFWMPMFLENKKFKGRIIFNKLDNMVKMDLNEVKEL